MRRRAVWEASPVRRPAGVGADGGRALYQRVARPASPNRIRPGDPQATPPWLACYFSRGEPAGEGRSPASAPWVAAGRTRAGRKPSMHGVADVDTIEGSPVAHHHHGLAATSALVC